MNLTGHTLQHCSFPHGTRKLNPLQRKAENCLVIIASKVVEFYGLHVKCYMSYLNQTSYELPLFSLISNLESKVLIIVDAITLQKRGVSCS